MVALLPIILAVSALGTGIASGISSVKSAQSQAEALKESTQESVDERAKAAKKLMQQQKTSYLKSGVYFNTGSAKEVIDETYDTYQEDINSMIDDTNTQIKNLERQGKTAFYTSLLSGLTTSALSYFGASGGSGGSTNTYGLTGGFGSVSSGGNSSNLTV